MQRISNKNLRESTIRHNQQVLQAYKKVISELGDYANLVPKGYIYERVGALTGYCCRKVASVINHFSNPSEN